MRNSRVNEQIRRARTIPLSINLIVVSDDEIRLRLVPFHWMVFDAKKWADTLLAWNRRECLDAAQHGEYDAALWYRQIADDLYDFLAAGSGQVCHPLLSARLDMTPHVVDGDSLVPYIGRVVASGAPAEDDLIDAMLLLDRDGGALRTTARALADHSGPAVDAELVDEGAMRGYVAPFLAYLRGDGSRDIEQAGGR